MNENHPVTIRGNYGRHSRQGWYQSRSGPPGNMNAFKHCLVSSNRWTVFSADRRASKATLGSTSDRGFFIPFRFTSGKIPYLHRLISVSVDQFNPTSNLASFPSANLVSLLPQILHFSASVFVISLIVNEVRNE